MLKIGILCFICFDIMNILICFKLPFKFDYGMFKWFRCFRGVFNMYKIKFINILN